MFAFRVELWQRLHLVHAPIYSCAHESLRRQIFEHLCVFALAVAHQWREQSHSGPFGKAEDLVDHLTDRLCREVDTVVWTPRNPGTRVKQAQIVVNLRNGADRRPWIV